MRGRVCRLQLLLTIAIAVILRSESRGTHDHILLSRIRTSPTSRARCPYLYPPGPGWLSYTPRHWLLFSSPHTTRRATVEVFTAAEICLPHSCVATSAARIHRERRLQHIFHCYVTSQRTQRIPLLRVYGPLPDNGCFSASTVLALSKYATIILLFTPLYLKRTLQ
jgi:hypothetical protein